MANYLEMKKRQQVIALLELGWSYRRIEAETGVRRETVSRLGNTMGTYKLTVEQNGVVLVTVGKYVTIWRKQVDESWKVVVDCFNADGPPVEA